MKSPSKPGSRETEEQIERKKNYLTYFSHKVPMFHKVIQYCVETDSKGQRSTSQARKILETVTKPNEKGDALIGPAQKIQSYLGLLEVQLLDKLGLHLTVTQLNSLTEYSIDFDKLLNDLEDIQPFEESKELDYWYLKFQEYFLDRSEKLKSAPPFKDECIQVLALICIGLVAIGPSRSFGMKKMQEFILSVDGQPNEQFSKMIFRTRVLKSFFPKLQRFKIFDSFFSDKITFKDEFYKNIDRDLRYLLIVYRNGQRAGRTNLSEASFVGNIIYYCLVVDKILQAKDVQLMPNIEILKKYFLSDAVTKDLASSDGNFFLGFMCQLEFLIKKAFPTIELTIDYMDLHKIVTSGGFGVLRNIVESMLNILNEIVSYTDRFFDTYHQHFLSPENIETDIRRVISCLKKMLPYELQAKPWVNSFANSIADFLINYFPRELSKTLSPCEFSSEQKAAYLACTKSLTKNKIKPTFYVTPLIASILRKHQLSDRVLIFTYSCKYLSTICEKKETIKIINQKNFESIIQKHSKLFLMQGSVDKIDIRLGLRTVWGDFIFDIFSKLSPSEIRGNLLYDQALFIIKIISLFSVASNMSRTIVNFFQCVRQSKAVQNGKAEIKTIGYLLDFFEKNSDLFSTELTPELLYSLIVSNFFIGALSNGFFERKEQLKSVRVIIKWCLDKKLFSEKNKPFIREVIYLQNATDDKLSRYHEAFIKSKGRIPASLFSHGYSDEQIYSRVKVLFSLLQNEKISPIDAFWFRVACLDKSFSDLLLFKFPQLQAIEIHKPIMGMKIDDIDQCKNYKSDCFPALKKHSALMRLFKKAKYIEPGLILAKELKGINNVGGWIPICLKNIDNASLRKLCLRHLPKEKHKIFFEAQDLFRKNLKETIDENLLLSFSAAIAFRTNGKYLERTIITLPSLPDWFDKKTYFSYSQIDNVFKLISVLDEIKTKLTLMSDSTAGFLKERISELISKKLSEAMKTSTARRNKKLANLLTIFGRYEGVKLKFYVFYILFCFEAAPIFGDDLQRIMRDGLRDPSVYISNELLGAFRLAVGFVGKTPDIFKYLENTENRKFFFQKFLPAYTKKYSENYFLILLGECFNYGGFCELPEELKKSHEEMVREKTYATLNLFIGEYANLVCDVKDPKKIARAIVEPLRKYEHTREKYIKIFSKYSASKFPDLNFKTLVLLNDILRFKTKQANASTFRRTFRFLESVSRSKPSHDTVHVLPEAKKPRMSL